MARIVAALSLALAALAACAPVPTPGPTGRVTLPDGASPGASNTAIVGSRLGAPLPAPERSAAMMGMAAPAAFRTAEATQSATELDFVASVLADMQVRSFTANRELCGYVGTDPSGTYVTTPISVGSEASCQLPVVPRDMTVIASIHTHSTYSPLYASEWPTTQDVMTDRSDGIDGYISTPGGRLWHVDTDSMTVREVCGRGCLPSDPRYRPEEDGPIRPVMAYADLVRWERG